jgi:hypothetical protein
VVTGPFTAVAATAVRIGWTHLDRLRFRTDKGEEVDLSADEGSGVGLQVAHAAARQAAPERSA